MRIAEPFSMIWNTLKSWWDGWLGLLLFGLAWVFCCVTLVLGPPATFGFFHAARWWMDEKEIKWARFYRMAKQDFIASWLWFLANLLMLFLVFANYTFYDSLANGVGTVLQVLSLGVGFLWLAVQFYALPYYVLLEKKSLWMAWKNGLFTLLASPVFSLILWIALAALLFLHLLIAPIFLAGPGLIVLLASMAVEDRIRKFGLREREAEKDAG